MVKSLNLLFQLFQPLVQFHVPVLEIAVDAVQKSANQQRPKQPVSEDGIDRLIFENCHFLRCRGCLISTAQRRGKQVQESKKRR